MASRRDDDRNCGFTMVELVVALTVMAVGIVGIVGLFTSSFGLTAGNNDRTRAVGVASGKIEEVRATQWSDLAVTPTTLREHVTVGGRTYTVDHAVTQASEGKQATVEVSWEAAGGRTESVHQSTLVYPGGLAGSGPATPSSPLTLAAPTAVIASIPNDVSGGTVVDLVWTNPVPANPTESWLVVEWSVNGQANSWNRVYDKVRSTANSIRVPGLSAGTTYNFRLSATSAQADVSAWSPIATVTTPTSVATVCSYGVMSVTPGKVKRHANHWWKLVSPVAVSVNTNGACSGLHLVYQPNPTSAAQSWPLTTAGGGVWSTTLPELNAHIWSVGTHTIDLYDQLETKRATAYLVVCDNASTC